MILRSTLLLKKAVSEMSDPIAQCFYTEAKNGWLINIRERESRDFGLAVGNELSCGKARKVRFDVYSTADKVIDAMHCIGVYQIIFNTPA